MHRRQLFASVCGMVLLFPAEPMCAQSRRKVTLQEQLEFGLKARRPEEFAYLETVVRLVDQETLPRRIVDSAFQWARSKRPYPYQYFVRALVILARRAGIKIPSGT